MVRPRASISRRAPGSSGATAEIRPSSMAMSAVRVFSAVTTVPPRMMRSAKVRLPLFQEVHAGVECGGHVLDADVFVRMMADAARRAEEEHDGGNFGRENHGIVSGAAGHAVHGIARGFHCLCHAFYQG